MTRELKIKSSLIMAAFTYLLIATDQPTLGDCYSLRRGNPCSSVPIDQCTKVLGCVWSSYEGHETCGGTISQQFCMGLSKDVCTNAWGCFWATDDESSPPRQDKEDSVSTVSSNISLPGALATTLFKDYGYNKVSGVAECVAVVNPILSAYGDCIDNGSNAQGCANIAARHIATVACKTYCECK